MNPVVAWAIGLGLFFIATLATVLPGSSLTRGSGSQQIYAEVQTIRANMAPKYLNQAGRYGTTIFAVPSLITKAIVPSSIIGPGNTLVNKWGGAVQITGATAYLNVDYDAAPQADCIDVVSSIAPGGVIVQATAATNLNGLSAATLYTAPVDSDIAETLCSGTSNAIRFVTN